MRWSCALVRQTQPKGLLRNTDRELLSRIEQARIVLNRNQAVAFRILDRICT